MITSTADKKLFAAALLDHLPLYEVITIMTAIVDDEADAQKK